MCFFTQQNAPAKKLRKRFNAEVDNEINLLVSNEIVGPVFPNIPIILNEQPNLIVTDYTWGLIPFWGSEIEETRRLGKLNATIETINEKPSYRSIVNKRCLIIATAFYEWHWNDAKGKSKDKYEIMSEDDEIFTFAGLYTTWQNPITGECKNTCTMITTEANELMSYIHNHKKRMPVVLKRNDEKAWLDSSSDISQFAFPRYEANLKAVNLNENRNYELF